MFRKKKKREKKRKKARKERRRGNLTLRIIGELIWGGDKERETFEKGGKGGGRGFSSLPNYGRPKP